MTISGQRSNAPGKLLCTPTPCSHETRRRPGRGLAATSVTAAMTEAVTGITTMTEAVVRATAAERITGITTTAAKAVVRVTTIERVAGTTAPIDGVSRAAAQGVATAMASTVTARAATIAAERIDEWITGNQEECESKRGAIHQGAKSLCHILFRVIVSVS